VVSRRVDLQQAAVMRYAVLHITAPGTNGESEVTSALNTVMMSPRSQERREDGNDEPVVLYPRSDFAGTVLAGLFDSSPGNFWAYFYYRNINQQQSGSLS